MELNLNNPESSREREREREAEDRFEFIDSLCAFQMKPIDNATNDRDDICEFLFKIYCEEADTTEQNLNALSNN